ncbi:FHA domain-containing protein [Demequina sp. SYSU T00192]|uniref:FHA domain-containing protein n=1 Tax=Demequina litoralis TaxID=3051660 RepID=A0ABT8GA96_9MICO|nr:FHA domain-containing protein [Demequina sp. SYSU T00192]MDN4476056.1 FHA domain-containing protein [Demequina sp. SYSU T00192]
MTAGVLTEVVGEATMRGATGIAVVGAAVLAYAAGLVWMGLALGAIYRKVGARQARAWIPVARYAELAQLTQSTVAGTVAARVATAIGLAVWCYGAYLAGSAPVALTGVAIASVAAVTAWTLWIVQTHRFGLDHSLSGALPVLAAIAPGLWAAVVGWSSMVRPISGTVPVRAPQADEEAAEAADDAVLATVPAGDGHAEAAVEAPAWGATPAAALWARAPEDRPDVAAMYPVEPFTGSDGYPEDEPMPGSAGVRQREAATSQAEPERAPTAAEPEQAPAVDVAASEAAAPEPAPEEPAAAIADEPVPEPSEASATEPAPTTEPLPTRRSPYASLAPRDLADETPAVERRSPFADLAPRALPSEEAAWTAAVGEDAAPAEPPAASSPTPAQPSAPADEARPAAADREPEPELESEPKPEPESARPEAPAFVEPTPTMPISPYMRGGAAAPPRVPSSVPTFEMPQAPEPIAEPEPVAEPVAEPAAAPVAEPVPPADLAAPPAPPAAEPAAHPFVITPPPAAPARPEPAPVPAASSPAPEPEHDDRTQVSTRQREAWELVTSEGGTHRFDSSSVLLGRLGGMPPIDGTRRLDLADSTRTVSKSHARLVLQRGTWWVEDLGSTNGTYLVDADGREAQVAEGVPTPVAGRLILGDVEVEIRRRSTA